MAAKERVEKQIGKGVFSIETGHLAKQATGCCIVQYGDTVVLSAVTTGPPRPGIDFFPLTCDYRERTSAAGKFPGGFIKREGRPSTKETLTARQIDRPIRPLFPERYFQEVQIIANVLSADQENDPDILAMIGASAALTISKIPFMGPTGACRLGRVNGEFVVNPTHKQLELSDLKLLLGGRKDAMNMIEVGAKELPENVIADAIAKAQETVRQVCEMIEELREKVGVEKEIPSTEIDQQLIEEIRSKSSAHLQELKNIPGKQERNDAVNEYFEEIMNEYCVVDDNEPDKPKAEIPIVKRILDQIEGEVVRKMILERDTGR